MSKARFIKQVYSQEFEEKISALMPKDYYLNQWYKNPNNQYQYIKKNTKGYYHIMEIVKNRLGGKKCFTFIHYLVTKDEMLKDTGRYYDFYETIADAQKVMNAEITTDNNTNEKSSTENAHTCNNCSLCFCDPSVGNKECECEDITEDELQEYFTNGKSNCPYWKN
jgi:hypothetical protein